GKEFCIVGDIFLVWGVVGAFLDVLSQLVFTGRLRAEFLWIGAVALGLGIAYSTVRCRQLMRSHDRMSVRQREYLNVLWLAIGVTVVAQLGGYQIFAAWASAALWTISAAIVTLYAGLHGNRAGLIGGVVLMASLVAANFSPHYEGFILAGGMLLGYAGFGLSAMLARD
ncbi:MAG TPA: hypothetical protein VMS32_08805, partial [Verrucomicrobiae bacterium]|nr:hypothetical protein [Verrucomicrobiae bacterium]